MESIEDQDGEGIVESVQESVRGQHPQVGQEEHYAHVEEMGAEHKLEDAAEAVVPFLAPETMHEEHTLLNGIALGLRENDKEKEEFQNAIDGHC